MGSSAKECNRMGDTGHPEDRRRKNLPIDVDRRTGERRQATRAAIDMWMEESKGNELYFRRTGNLSSGGVYFEQSIPHPLGTCVSLKFTLPGESHVIQTKAEIVNTPNAENGLGMGVRFIDLSHDNRRRIETYVQSAVERPGDS